MRRMFLIPFVSALLGGGLVVAVLAATDDLGGNETTITTVQAEPAAPSNASQTAWALLAYVSGGAAEGLSTRRAAEYVLQMQRPDGDWDESHYTGTGFPLDFMIRYHLYRLTFPLLALGRLRERLTG